MKLSKKLCLIALFLVVIIFILFILRKRYEYFVVSESEEEENYEMDACERTCISRRLKERPECVADCRQFIKKRLMKVYP